MIQLARVVIATSLMILTVGEFFSPSASAAQMLQTTASQVQGTPATATEHLRGTVVKVDGTTLLVRMSTGEIREFSVPSTRKFIIGGQQRSLRELKPGTVLNATVTTTTTPGTTTTTTTISGKVWYVSGNTVILTLPNGENKEYKVEESYRFIVNGQKASVHQLRPGMIVSASKIVEEPTNTITSDVTVIGEAPNQIQHVEALQPRTTTSK